jgi:hypothetical protein
MAVSDARDWAIIVLAIINLIQSLLIIAILAVAAWQGWRAWVKVRPVLDNVQVVGRNAQATSIMVSDYVVKPVVAIASFVIGVQRAVSVFVGAGKRKEKEERE